MAKVNRMFRFCMGTNIHKIPESHVEEVEKTVSRECEKVFSIETKV